MAEAPVRKMEGRDRSSAPPCRPLIPSSPLISPAQEGGPSACGGAGHPSSWARRASIGRAAVGACWGRSSRSPSASPRNTTISSARSRVRTQVRPCSSRRNAARQSGAARSAACRMRRRCEARLPAGAGLGAGARDVEASGTKIRSSLCPSSAPRAIPSASRSVAPAPPAPSASLRSASPSVRGAGPGRARPSGAERSPPSVGRAG